MGNTHNFEDSWSLLEGQFQDTAFNLDLVDIDINPASGEQVANGVIQVCRRRSRTIGS